MFYGPTRISRAALASAPLSPAVASRFYIAALKRVDRFFLSTCAGGGEAAAAQAPGGMTPAEVCFGVPPRCISVARGPEAFFSAVMGCVQLASRRLLVSALYIGSGEKERRMLQLLQQRARQKEELEVCLLLDFLRSTRPASSGGATASLLLPLLQPSQGVGSCRVSFFCNPLTCSSSASGRVRQLLDKVTRNVLGHRHREALGTQHMKFVVSDDLLLLTGANLSADYFSTRTDRCICVRSRPLCDAVQKIFVAVEAHSYQLLPQQQLQEKQQLLQQEQRGRVVEIGGVTCMWPATNPSPPPQIDAKAFCKSLSGSLSAALAESGGTSGDGNRGANSVNSAQSEMCLISLGIQAGFACPPVRGQEMFLEKLYQIAANSIATATATDSPAAAAKILAANKGATNGGEFVEAATSGGIQVVVASPYLNFPAAFLSRLQLLVQQMRTASASGHSCASSKSRLVVVAASPQANSFFMSKGLSYWIPAAYAVAAHTTASALKASAGLASTAAAGPVAAPTVAGAFASKRQQLQQREDNLQLLEFARPGWTFHAKGIWITGRDSISKNHGTGNSAGELLPPPSKTTNLLLQERLTSRTDRNGSGGAKGWAAVSLFGSSNFSVRSSQRDLELLALLRTRDVQLLQEQWKEVEHSLLPFCQSVSAETLRTRFPLWLLFAVRFLGLGSFL